MGSGFDKLVVVVVNKIIDCFIASFFGLLLEEHGLACSVVRYLHNLFTLAKRERGSGDVGVLAVGGVLGQDQGADLNHFISTNDRLHGVAVVEVAVAEWVHAYLHPGRVVDCRISAGLSVGLADG